MPRTSEPPPLLLDTHIWLWLMLATGQLSPAKRIPISEAIGSGRLRLSAITFWEIAFLASRNRVQLGKPVKAWIEESLAGPGPLIEPLSAEIAAESWELPGGFRSDPADQIIVATARVTGAALMTRDRRILDYAAAGYLTALPA